MYMKLPNLGFGMRPTTGQPAQIIGQRPGAGFNQPTGFDQQELIRRRRLMQMGQLGQMGQAGQFQMPDQMGILQALSDKFPEFLGNLAGSDTGHEN